MASLEYVFSGPRYTGIAPTTYAKENPETQAKIAACVKSALGVITKQCSEMMKGADVTTSILFNAHTEATIGPYLRKDFDYGFKKIYADSGGLQMVTTGTEITPEAKLGIYETQKIANYGFCFDEIPLGVKDGAGENGKHRSQTGSKLFFPEGLSESARLTALNVKDQTDAFDGTRTKAFYILQGNSLDEMCKWFDAGVANIPKENFSRIQGVAPADTCIGNGVMESVEMLMAVHVLKDRYGPDYVSNHLHLLGVGSPTRLLPAMFLSDSGALGANNHVSFDSSSSSMAYVMGNFVDYDGARCKRQRDLTMKMFGHFYDQLGHHLLSLSPNLDKARFLDHVGKYYKSYSETIRLCEPDIEAGCRAIVPLVCMWQNLGFFKRLEIIISDPETEYSPIGFLSEVKNIQDYNAWVRQFSRFVESKRIDRDDASSLMDMFE